MSVSCNIVILQEREISFEDLKDAVISYESVVTYEPSDRNINISAHIKFQQQQFYF